MYKLHFVWGRRDFSWKIGGEPAPCPFLLLGINFSGRKFPAVAFFSQNLERDFYRKKLGEILVARSNRLTEIPIFFRKITTHILSVQSRSDARNLTSRTKRFLTVISMNFVL